MPNASPQTAAPIRARVHDGALRRVTRFFSSTPADIFSELLQNARRAGANRVGVDTEGLPEGEGGGIRVTVTDDGTGVGDAAVLLSFGETGWDEATARNEDAAGMGLASLARRGCRVSSRQAMSKGVPAPGWRVALTPAHFLGEENAHSAPRQQRAVSERDRRLVQGGRDPGRDRGGAHPRGAALSAGRDLQRRDRGPPRLPRRHCPCRALARPYVRRLQERLPGLQRSGPQLPWADPAGAPAAYRHPG